MDDNTFRTVFKPEPAAEPLDLTRPVLLMGSCFADNIGSRLRRDMIDAIVNPAGTLFNPLSISSVCEMALSGEIPSYEQHGELWDSWWLPTEFSSPDADKAQQAAATAMSRLRQALRTAGTMIVTFGTAVVYLLAEKPYPVVSNCHRQPSSRFLRDMVTPENIVTAWQEFIDIVRRENPTLRFIFTVSPVRHVRDGMHINTLSKATLQLAVDRLLRSHENCHYFPAYEIMLDDLRDYRWCDRDMAHPSPQAADYIYSLFCRTWLSETDRKMVERARCLRSRMDHRLLHPDTKTAAAFVQATADMLAALQREYPCLRP